MPDIHIPPLIQFQLLAAKRLYCKMFGEKWKVHQVLNKVGFIQNVLIERDMRTLVSQWMICLSSLQAKKRKWINNEKKEKKEKKETEE